MIEGEPTPHLSIVGAPSIRTAAMGARERRIRLLQVLQDWLTAIARAQPVILAFEDVQWIDPTSRMLLSRLLVSARQHPMLILVTQRTDDAEDESSAVSQTDWLAVPGVAKHVLDELDMSGSRQLIAAVAAGRTMPDSIVADIMTKAAGIPFYVEELTRCWLEAARETSAVAGSSTVAGTSHLPEVRIPESLSGALMARVDRLGPHKDVALKAAVIGAEFTADLLERVAEIPAASTQAGLAVLVEAGILRPVVGTAEPTYRFRHALIRDTAYDSLMTARRRDLHRQVALAMEEMRVSRPETSADLIAQHYARNHSPRNAIQLWQRAAEQAVAKSAHDEAAGLLDKALSLIRELPATPERDALELELTAASAASLRSVRGYAAPVVEKRYLTARELCERVGNGRIRFYVDWGLFQCHLVKGELDRADEFAERLMLNTGGLPDTLRADAYLATGMVRLQQGEFESARQFLEQAADLTDPLYDEASVSTHGQNPGLFSRSNLAQTLWFLGHPQSAETLIQKNLDIARLRATDPTHVYTLVNSLAFGIRVHHCLRNASVVDSLAQELLQIAERYHYAYYQQFATVRRGWARASTGAFDAGVTEMIDGLGKYHAGSAALGQASIHMNLADLYCAHGRFDDAERALNAATGEKGTRVWDAELLRLKAEAAARRGGEDLCAIESTILQSLSVARQQGSLALELRALTTYAKILHMKSDTRQASLTLREGILKVGAAAYSCDGDTARSLLESLEREQSNG